MSLLLTPANLAERGWPRVSSLAGHASLNSAPGPESALSEAYSIYGVILALLLLLALTSIMLLDGYLRAEVGGDQRVRTGPAPTRCRTRSSTAGPS